MVFIQQHSIMCLLRNKRFRTETFNTHVGQILGSILAEKDKGIFKKAQWFNSTPLTEKLYSRNMKHFIFTFQKVSSLFKTALKKELKYKKYKLT